MGVAYSNNTVSQMGEDNSSENSGLRTKAVAAFQKVVFGQIVVGGALLACGIAAIIYYDDSAFGPPYFVGAMVAGPLVLLTSLCTIQIIRYTSRYDVSQEAKNTIHCAFIGALIMSVFTFMGLFMGFAMLGISGQLSKECDFPNDCDDPETWEINRNIAIAIVVLLSLTIPLLVFVIYTICTTSSAYGAIHNQGRNHMNQQLINQQAALQLQMMNNAGGAGMRTQNAQVTALQQQNMLLQQQLALQQQQLQMQNQQQQPAPGTYGGFAPPPPSYESVVNPYPPLPSAPSDFGKM